MKLLFSVILLSLLFLSGCGGGGGGASGGTTPPPADTTSTLSGTAIDGLIKSAKVCIDLNDNNLCDSGEPFTTTDTNGNYSLDVDNSLGTKTLLVLGGIDTATNKAFDGVLKETVTISSSDIASVNITPLTTVSTELYLNEKASNPAYLPQTAKETIASNLGLSTADITRNPLTNTQVFETTQKIVQATKLLQSELQKDDTNTTLNQKAFAHIIKQVALAIKSDTTTGDFNSDNVIEKLETTTYNAQTIAIPTNLKTFTKSYVDEIGTKFSSVSSTSDLANLQSGIEVYTDEAKILVKSSSTPPVFTTILTGFVAKNTTAIVQTGRNANSTLPSITQSTLSTPPRIPTL